MLNYIKKHIIVVFFMGLFLFIFLFYNGIFNKYIMMLFSKIQYEWDISYGYTAYFYNPMWACGPECPPFAIIEINRDREIYQGKEIHVFRDGKNLSQEGETAQAGSFFMCYGDIKKTLYIYMWEFTERRLINKSDDLVVGEIFDAKYCEHKTPTIEQSLYIEKYLKEYSE